MPTTNSSKRQVVPVRITPALRRQLDDLVAAGFGNQNEVIRIAVDRMHRQELYRKGEDNKEDDNGIPSH